MDSREETVEDSPVILLLSTIKKLPMPSQKYQKRVLHGMGSWITVVGHGAPPPVPHAQHEHVMTSTGER